MDTNIFERRLNAVRYARDVYERQMRQYMIAAEVYRQQEDYENVQYFEAAYLKAYEKYHEICCYLNEMGEMNEAWEVANETKRYAVKKPA